MTSYFYNIPIGNVKKLEPKNEHLQFYLRLGLKLKIHRQWLTPYVEFNTRKRIEAKQKKIVTRMKN